MGRNQETTGEVLIPKMGKQSCAGRNTLGHVFDGNPYINAPVLSLEPVLSRYVHRRNGVLIVVFENFLKQQNRTAMVKNFLWARKAIVGHDRGPPRSQKN